MIKLIVYPVTAFIEVLENPGKPWN